MGHYKRSRIRSSRSRSTLDRCILTVSHRNLCTVRACSSYTTQQYHTVNTVGRLSTGVMGESMESINTPLVTVILKLIPTTKTCLATDGPVIP
jgi:hypothetical protein